MKDDLWPFGRRATVWLAILSALGFYAAIAARWIQ